MGNQTWQIVKGLEGEIFEESFATRVVDVSPTNPEAYVQAVRNMEKVYHDNGYDRVQFDIHQTGRSGASGFYKVVVLAPSLQIRRYFWCASIRNMGAGSILPRNRMETELLSDKAYRCEQCVFCFSNTTKINVVYLN